jgi:hypothetical protein
MRPGIKDLMVLHVRSAYESIDLKIGRTLKKASFQAALGEQISRLFVMDVDG